MIRPSARQPSVTAIKDLLSSPLTVLPSNFPPPPSHRTHPTCTLTPRHKLLLPFAIFFRKPRRRRSDEILDSEPSPTNNFSQPFPPFLLPQFPSPFHLALTHPTQTLSRHFHYCLTFLTTARAP